MSLYDLAARAVRLLPPEAAHEATVTALAAGLGPRRAAPDDAILATRLAGLSLPNPVGLAAGFDKGAQAPDALLAAGFGSVEIGTVTPRAQPGNPRPRLFRLTEDRAVINRMGFNSEGHEAVRARLAARSGRAGVVGVNLGANKTSEDKVADYVAGLAAFWGLADYFTINISSPNTPGLRDLQGPGALEALLEALNEAREDLSGDAPSPPVFLKIAPDDQDDDSIERIVQAAREAGVQGLIVSNTTVARPGSLQSRHKTEAGGLSGAPLMAPSTRLLKKVRAVAGPSMTLIGVGGIASAADAYAKIRAGANAVQLYSALVFAGPGLVAEIKSGLADLLRADGFASVAEAVGGTQRVSKEASSRG